MRSQLQNLFAPLNPVGAVNVQPPIKRRGVDVSMTWFAGVAVIAAWGGGEVMTPKPVVSRRSTNYFRIQKNAKYCTIL